MLWAIDETADGALAIDYPYFERAEPIVDDDGGTYVTTDASFQTTLSHSWNHGLGEVVTALLDRGLRITGLVEHVSVPWEAIPGRMVRDDRGEWQLADRPWRLAASYTLQAVKPHKHSQVADHRQQEPVVALVPDGLDRGGGDGRLARDQVEEATRSHDGSVR